MKKICCLIVICFMFIFLGNQNFMVAKSNNLDDITKPTKNEETLELSIEEILELPIEEIEELLLPKAVSIGDISNSKYASWIDKLILSKYNKKAMELFTNLYGEQPDILDKVISLPFPIRCSLASMYYSGNREKVNQILQGTYSFICNSVPYFIVKPTEVKLYMEGYDSWDEYYNYLVDLVNKYLYLYFEENPKLLEKLNQLSIEIRNYIVVSLN